jgi:EAL domain-containing protein (putative c-di-GMP-specific phosphodiesterase class I)
MTAFTPEQIAQLGQIAGRNDPVMAGAVKLVGIADVLAHYKDDWPSVREKVLRQAQYAIEKAIGPNDVAVQVGDAGFMFIFANPDPMYAERMSLAAADAVRLRLFGQDAYVAAKIHTAIRTFSVNPNELSTMVQDTGTMFALSGVNEAEPEAPKEQEPAAPSPARVRYRPIWDVTKNVIIDVSARPQGAQVARGRPFGAAESTAERRAAFEIDLQTMEAVSHELQRLIANGTRLLVAPSISASSFSNATSTARMVSAFRAIPAEARQLLRCTIYETRGGVRVRDVEHAVRSLIPLCRGINVSSIGDEDSFDFAKSMGVNRIGIDLEPFKHIPERAVMEKLERFCFRARNAGLQVLIDSVATRSMSSFVACSGANFIGGPVIGPDFLEAPPAIRFSARHLYARRA